MFLFSIVTLIAGGAVYAQRSSLTLVHSSFMSNVAQQSGGALSAQEADLSLIVCTFMSNKALTGDGGAIALLISTLREEGGTFGHNYATQGKGGCMALETGCIGSFVGSSFSRSLATQGGALSIFGSSAVLEWIVLESNGILGESIGGAMYADTVSSLTIKDTLFLDGLAKDGGGMYLLDVGDFFLNNVTFQENKAVAKDPSQSKQQVAKFITYKLLPLILHLFCLVEFVLFIFNFL